MKKKTETSRHNEFQMQDEVLRKVTGGCGGMTQIDPPSLELDPMLRTEFDAVLDESEEFP